jgi:hypothetical protein
MKKLEERIKLRDTRGNETKEVFIRLEEEGPTDQQ